MLILSSKNVSFLFIMFKQQNSASLQTNQANQLIIEINQNGFEIELDKQRRFCQHQQHDDTFQLSLNQKSLSFESDQVQENMLHKNIFQGAYQNTQIQVLNKSSVQKQQLTAFPPVQQYKKRKNKETLQKHKQKSAQNLATFPGLQLSSNDSMITPDQISRIKSPQNQENNNNISFQKKGSQSDSRIYITAFIKKQSVTNAKVVSLQQNRRVIKYNSIYKVPLFQKDQNKGSITQFQIPSNISQFKIIDELDVVIRSTNSFIIKPSVNVVPMLEADLMQHQQARDFIDIEGLLKSQIFRDQMLDETFGNGHTSYNQLQLSTTSPSVMPVLDKTSEDGDEPHRKLQVTTNPSAMLEKLNYGTLLKESNLQKRIGMTRDKSWVALPTNQDRSILKRNLSQGELRAPRKIAQSKPDLRTKISSQTQSRVPIYLRLLRCRNAVYRNFNLRPNGPYDQQNRLLKELLFQFKGAITFLYSANQRVYERYNCLKSRYDTLLNNLTIDTFIGCGWEQVPDLEWLGRLRPHGNCKKRMYEYHEVKGLLSDFISTVQYHQKGSLGLQGQKAQKEYLEVRAKLWKIQRHIESIGQDVYFIAVQKVFPPHYFEFLKVLKAHPPSSGRTVEQLQYMKKLLGWYLALKSEGDLLCMSQIGNQVKNCLQGVIQKYL